MSQIRVVFLGTPEFACEGLKQLIKDDHFQVVGVVTQPDRRSGRKMQLRPSPVKELALKHKLAVISPESINEENVLNEIKTWNAEAAVVVAFGQIVSQKFLDMYPGKVVNLHASLLPKWRGAAPIQRSIMAGDKETGVCLQVMVKKLDAGAVLGKRKILLNDDKNAKQLHDEMAILGGELLHVEFMDYLRGHLTPHPQEESLVTYAKKIEKTEGLIDFNDDALNIHRKVLGLIMGPGSYTFLDGKMLKVHKTRVMLQNQVRTQEKIVPGQIVAINEGIKVQCGQDFIEILEIQPESRPKMSVSEYIKGKPLNVGQRFSIE
ncbi:MAG: methionyl-tRNA formyltransferase [Bdellovibrionaceae bacterium]|nr:methionyl-tRNA formyltransferase [Pseudobdellovibrionaceae bacterium]